MNVYKEASMLTGIPKDIVEKAYYSYWRAIREHFSSLPLKEDIEEKDFIALKPSVSISSIGKLFVTYDRQRAMRERYKEYIKENNKKENKDVAHKED